MGSCRRALSALLNELALPKALLAASDTVCSFDGFKIDSFEIDKLLNEPLSEIASNASKINKYLLKDSLVTSYLINLPSW